MKNMKVVTSNSQPIKSIIHQDIYSLSDILEQLSSWNGALELLNEFFNDQNRSVNKMKPNYTIQFNIRNYSLFTSSF